MTKLVAASPGCARPASVAWKSCMALAKLRWLPKVGWTKSAKSHTGPSSKVSATIVAPLSAVSVPA